MDKGSSKATELRIEHNFVAMGSGYQPGKGCQERRRYP